MEWYYVKESERIGPLSEDAFATLVAENAVQADTLVWNDQLDDWLQYGALQSIDHAAAPNLSYHPCAECGQNPADDAVIAYNSACVCAACKPILFQRVSQGTLKTVQGNYAGFWIRFCAKMVDNILLGCVTNAFSMLAMTILSGGEEVAFGIAMVMTWFFSLAASVAYVTWFLGKFGATPGKMIFGIEVVRSDGQRITYLRAFARFCAEIVSGVILSIGYLIAAFDEEKRTLHDHMCDTRVVKTG